MMPEKIKISKEDFKFLRKDIELETKVVEELAKRQKEKQKKFEARIQVADEEALKRYRAHITNLEKAKKEALERYEAEIEKYKELEKELKKKVTKPK